MKTAADQTSRQFEDYLKLPFEVVFSDTMPVMQMEFMSDVDVKSISDVKVVHIEEGNCESVVFKSSRNNGPELVACILNRIGDVNPSWLSCESDEIDMNYGRNLRVVVDGNEIEFQDLSEDEEDPDSEDFLDTDNMDYCCSDAFFCYFLEDASPDYIVLDANNSRITVNLDGYVLDEDGEETQERLFIPEELATQEEFEQYEVLEFEEKRALWVASVLEQDFPKEKHLTLGNCD